jgi:phosphoserine aminotransferase
MSKKIFFTPGPSALYFTVESHIKQALKSQVLEINHRSNQAAAYFQEATENLKSLMGIPKDYHIFYLSSATEIWERLIQNCVQEKSTHLTYGAFSNRFYDFSKKLGFDATSINSDLGEIPEFSLETIDNDTELISLALNETSTGVTFPVDRIYELNQHFPDTILAIDGVSAFPVIDIDFSKIDSAYFSVQKCFGLPAGLGVWIVNDKCIAKAEKKLKEGQSIGTYQSLPNLLKSAEKYQPTYTTNVLDVYLLAKVTSDMLGKGIDVIRREARYKSSLLQHMVDQHTDLTHYVKNPHLRSKTVIVANTKPDSNYIINELSKKGLIVGNGYGALKGKQIRIASFPTHSKEQIEMLVDEINKISY